MFYSQIILAKKGPLGRVWLAAHHWGSDKKLGGRPAVFATDISETVSLIEHPAVPLALRVSGHLLLGVVRIYSKQVQYLEHDVHVAMMKLKQLASASSTTNKSTQQKTKRKSSRGGNKDANNNSLNVSNFGEYQDVVLETLLPSTTTGGANTAAGFVIPFDLNDETAAQDWVPAELDDDEEEGEEDDRGRSRNDTTLTTEGDDSMMVDRSLTSRGSSRGGQQGALLDVLQQPQGEDQWTAFDPDEEEEEEDEEGSKASDVEVTRAARDSSISETASQVRRRASVLNDSNATSVGGGQPSPGAGAAPPQDDDFVMPFDDDYDEFNQPPPATTAGQEDIEEQDSLSHDGSDGGRARQREGARKLVGGLDDSSLEDDQQEKKVSGKKRASETKGRRKKKQKLRKVVVDITDEGGDQTALSGKHIRDMLNDTSDTMLDFVHPATAWYGMDEAEKKRLQKKKDNANMELLYKHLSYEKLFTRPGVGDDGGLAPELLELYAANTAPILGKPFPYKLLTKEQQKALREENGEDEEEESIEETRQQRDSAEGADHLLEQGMSPPPFAPEDHGQFPPPPDDDDAPMPFDDDDNIPPKPHDDSGFANDMEGMKAGSPSSRESTMSLGLVNDLEQDIVADEDDPRQEAGDSTAVSSTAKWHKHTVKVYDMLRRNMAVPGEDQDEDEAAKPDHLSYDSLSKGCSRRTAAGVFFELLQLKTWDFIELEQAKSYGDIQISCGAKFGQDPPSN